MSSTDEVARMRQKRCARSVEGHEFGAKGKCLKCGLTIVPSENSSVKINPSR